MTQSTDGDNAPQNNEALDAANPETNGTTSVSRPDASSPAPLPGAKAPSPRRKQGSRKPKRQPSAAPNNRQGWLTPLHLVLLVLRALGVPRFCRDVASPGRGLSNIPAVMHHVEEPGNPEGGGLSASWVGGVIWMNPPYADPYPWCQRAAEAVRSGDVGLVVGLLPVRPDAAWHRHHVTGRAHLIALDRRVRFEVERGVPGGSPTFSTHLVLWGGTREQVRRLREAFAGCDFRPAPTWWGEPLPPHIEGGARGHAAAVARRARGSGSRARSGKGDR